MVGRETQNFEQTAKRPALDVLHFIATEQAPTQTLEELQGFLNEYEYTRVLTAVIETHGSPNSLYLPNQTVSGADDLGSFSASVHKRVDDEPFLLHMYAHSNISDTDIFGMTVPLDKNGSLDNTGSITAWWGNKHLKYNLADPAANDETPAPIMWIMQGIAVRMANTLRGPVPPASIIQSDEIPQLLAA